MKNKNSTSIAIILMVVLAWFSPWWISGKNLAPLDLQNQMMSPWRAENETRFAKNHIVSDGVDQYLVYRMMAAESYAKEGWLGWSSLTYGGTAQYANTMALYYDWTMQLHRWFKFWTAWHLGLMGQVILAATGMFLFLRGRSIGMLWSCCGALAYAANSQFVTWVYHRWALGAFCWVPWILWAIDGYRRGKRLSWSLVPIFVAMAFLGGTLQHSVLVVLAVAAMWLEEAILQNSKSGSTAQWQLLGRYAAWGILGTGLAAMMLLPCADAFITSNKLGLHTGLHGNTENGVYPLGWTQPLFNLAAYPLQIFPSLLGRCGSMDVLKLFKSDLFYVTYFGALPVLIAFLAIWRKTAPLLARILIAGGLILPLTPLLRLLYQRLFLLFIVGGIFAFTHFMQHSTRKTRLKVFRVTISIAGIAALAWSAASLVLLVRPEIGAGIKARIMNLGSGGSFGYFQSWLETRADRFVGDLSIWSPHQIIPLILLAAGIIGLRWTASLRPSWRLKGSLLVALVIIIEVSLFGARWIVWSDPSNAPLFPETVETAILRKEVGRDGRISTLNHPTAHMPRTPFVPNTLSAYGIAVIGGYDSIVPDGMILPNKSPGDAKKLGRFGVSHMITWTGNPDIPSDWKHIWSSPLMELYENPFAVPRYAGLINSEEMADFFDGSHATILPVSEHSGKENTRSLTAPIGTEWIRIAENHADGWQFRILPNKKWQSVERAKDSSILIKNSVPDRKAQIEMRYHPPLRRLGFIISAGSFLLVLLAGFTKIRPHAMTTIITPTSP